VADTWAVGAAVALALFALAVPPSPLVAPPTGPIEPAPALQWLLPVAAIATWGYGIAVAAHGSRGAVASLLVDALAAAALGVLLIARSGLTAPLVLLSLAALAASWALARELASRRGAAHAGAVVTYAAATVALVAWRAAAELAK
jgi:hypothetical protein